MKGQLKNMCAEILEYFTDTGHRVQQTTGVQQRRVLKRSKS